MPDALSLYIKDPKIKLDPSNQINPTAKQDDKVRKFRRVSLFILLTTITLWGLSLLVTIDDIDMVTYQCPDKINLYEDYYYTPEQIHLSLGSNETEFYVTWSTRQPVEASELHFNQEGDTKVNVIVGELTVWTSTEKNQKLSHATRTAYMDHYTYRARLNNIKPNGHYYYFIKSILDGATASQSRIYDFYSKNLSDPNGELNIAFYGDLGLVNGQSIPRLIRDVDQNLYDLIIHNGDFAYDLNTNHGWVGDDFMRLIEPIAARVPYQTSVGNHEIAEKFLHYDKRFTMVNSGGTDNGLSNNLFYSFNAGPIHFIAISTEFYYFLDYLGLEPLSSQWAWLERDLALANQPEERAKRPWVIVFGHRPMYCSSRDGDDCSKDSNILRKGLPFIGSYALEKLLYKSGVDVEIYAHEHQYERFLPIFNGKIMNGTDVLGDPYFNPLGPVHIISGSAGCQERIDPFQNNTAPGSIKQIADYGYSRLKAERCKLTFQQISDDKQGQVVDEFIVTKTRTNFPKRSTETFC